VYNDLFINVFVEKNPFFWDINPIETIMECPHCFVDYFTLCWPCFNHRKV